MIIVLKGLSLMLLSVPLLWILMVALLWLRFWTELNGLVRLSWVYQPLTFGVILFVVYMIYQVALRIKMPQVKIFAVWLFAFWSILYTWLQIFPRIPLVPF